MSFVSDTFTGTDSTNLTAHTGETGATWTKGNSYVGTWMITTNRARLGGSTNQYIVDVPSGAPATADYDVQAVFHFFSAISNHVGMFGRFQNASPSGTSYEGYLVGVSNGVLQLRKHIGTPNVISNPGSILASWGTTLVAGTDYTVKLRMRGSIIQVWVDGTKIIQANDTTITGAGKPALAGYTAYGAAAGVAFDNFTASDPPIIGQHNYSRSDGDWEAKPYQYKAGGTWHDVTGVTER